MNVDFYGLFEFGDVEALKQFSLAHRFAHDAESDAIATQLNVTIGTYEVGGLEVIDEWTKLMTGEQEVPSQAMYDWLERHNQNHQAMLAALGQASMTAIPLVASDLSMADFADPDQMFEWLTIHQQMHQFEQQALGLN